MMQSILLPGLLIIAVVVGVTAIDESFAIACGDKKEIIKFKTREIYCVTEDTFDKLVEKGWGDGRYAFWKIKSFTDRDPYTDYDKKEIVKERAIHMPGLISVGGIPDSITARILGGIDIDPPIFYGNGTFIGHNNVDYNFNYQVSSVGFRHFSIENVETGEEVASPTYFSATPRFIDLLANHTDFIERQGIPDSIRFDEFFYDDLILSFGGGTFESLDKNTYSFYFVQDDHKLRILDID